MTVPQSRSVGQVHQEVLEIPPDGWASTHSPDEFLGARFRPLANELSLIEASALSMLPQIDPREAPNLLPDWERMLGPDPCQVAAGITDTATLADFAFARLTNAGTICAGYFENYALSIGETIAIEEFRASTCGMARCGDRLCPQPHHCEILITLPGTIVAVARCGVSRCGDRIGTFDRSVMECVIRNEAPLWVTPFFSYT